MMGRILQKAAESIYSVLERGRLAYLFFPKEVRQDLWQLHKEEKQYYIQKLQYVIGLILLGGMLVGFYVIQTLFGSNEQVARLERPQAHEDSQEFMLKVGEQEFMYSLEVSPIALTAEEAEALFREAVTVLQHDILGSNISLNAVTENLILPDYLDGYPFDIYWESDREQVVDHVGCVNRTELTEDTVVVLTAEFCYREWLWQEQFGILVLKENLTEEEQYKRALGSFLAAQESAGRKEEVWELPKEFEGEELQYQVVSSDYTLLWLALIIAVAGLCLWFGKDYDLRAARSKRQEIFRAEYAALVSSLSLYISAGMTLQKAMVLCAADYEKRKPQGHLLRLALWEFQKDLENGYSFSAALGRFSEFCDDANYKKLAGLLNQGVLNGAQGLAALLEKEAEQVREEKRRQAKVKGEQVSTALIAPMMLQLGIVIALIMLPAFSSLQF